MNLPPLPRRIAALAALGLFCAASLPASGATHDAGFNRILPGWTNYSTSFGATHDLGPDDEFATVASFYTPPVDARPTEYSVIVVWFGLPGEQFAFSNFTFQVHFWSSLGAFLAGPKLGDVGVLNFPAPTGGSTTVPDAYTRGGRPAYLLRFDLSPAAFTLARCQTYLVGFAARTTNSAAGELLVPTAPHRGFSDVQAGNLVPFGWSYLINLGGPTVYFGQLAVALAAQPEGQPPRLLAQRTGGDLCLAWPASAGCYTLESSDDLASPGSWFPVTDPEPPVEPEGGFYRLCIPATEAARYYRLRKASESTPPPY